MIIYQGTVGEFKQHVLYAQMADMLEAAFRKVGKNHNNQGEHRAWENSLNAMKDVLDIARTNEDVSVSIEYEIPTTSKRVDFILSGYDENNNNNVIVVELKQWSDCKETQTQDLVMVPINGYERLVTHPCYQASSYTKTIENFSVPNSKEKISLIPCAFCHNFEEKNRNHIDNEFYKPAIQEADLFLHDDRKKLADFINRYIKKSDQGKAIVAIDHGTLRPSKALQDALSSMIKGNTEFIMLDDQKVAYEKIMEIVRKSNGDKKKRTVIVQGGPGTGKSVIAMNLFANLNMGGTLTTYVTKNSAPREVYFAELRKGNFKANYIKNFFKSSGAFVDAHANEYNVILVDEAHRLNFKSGMFKNKGENQMKEIINAGLVSVFFLDEDQKVTMSDVGTADEIRKQVKELGSILYEGEDYVLSSQFRCNGSDGYIAFLDNLLQRKETANYNLNGLDYDFRVFDDASEMREALRKLNGNNKARMVAGYCYPWNSKKDSSEMDIVLPGFEAQWNFSSTSTWAIDENSFDQVGCIHTSQGLEFDYVGVIIGKDMYLEDGVVKTNYDIRMKAGDKSLVGIKKNENKSIIGDELTKNTYKVLMTRGRKGCFVYCEDKALAEYIIELSYFRHSGVNIS